MNKLAQLTIKGDFDQVRQLATKELVIARGDGGRTVLMMAADVNSTPEQFGKCIEYLLHLGADASATDTAGDTAAHLAARRDHLRLLALLPFEAKFSANGKRLTPLMEAVQNKKWKCAIHLLYLFRQRKFRMHKFPLLSVGNNNGQTVLQMAEASRQTELAGIIEREMRLQVCGDDSRQGSWQITGLSPSETATRDKMKLLAKKGDLAGLLRVVNRANCDLPDEFGETALKWAAMSDCDDGKRLQKLADIADVTCTDAKSSSCLHGAARRGKAGSVRILVASGAPVNAIEDYTDRTPLMWAATCAPIATAAAAGGALLAAGADLSLKDTLGKTAIDLAVAERRSELADLLRGHEGKSSFIEKPIEKPSRGRAVTDDVYDDASQNSEESDSGVSKMTKQPKTVAKPEGATATKPKAASQKTGFYPVTSPQGICYIININHYDVRSGFTNRDGSEKDVLRVSSLFKELDFVVKSEKNLKGHEIYRSIQQMALKDHSEFGIFVCFLMAHGTNEAIYGSDGFHQNLKELATAFGANNCPSLAHKPKIFFLQACRGQHAEVAKEKMDSKPVPSTLKDQCPSKSDFLFSFASSEDAPAYRDPETGSLFIQTLCRVIEAGYTKEHLLDLMTEVNRIMMANPVTTASKRGKELYFHVVADLHTQLKMKVSLKPNEF